MSFSRRDFLKLTAALTASTLARPGLKLFPTRLSANPDAKNILIIVFDALSAYHINYYGYPRETMPYLTRLLDRATVYHNHYSSSNFTSPGTASLLTGRPSWDHLALKLRDETRPGLADKNIFALFDDYYKVAYAHNYFADIFLSQFGEHITHHEYFKNLFLEYYLTGSNRWFDRLMWKDPDTSSLFKNRLTDTSLDGYLFSLLFPSLLGDFNYQAPDEIADRYPRGVPLADKQDPFILENGIDWAMLQAANSPQPFLGYFHFLPPHDPYNTRDEFFDIFKNDGFQPTVKPLHPVVIPDRLRPDEKLIRRRRRYDEFILYADAEFNRLFTFLDQNGLLDNTLVIFTSDHGEMFERGAVGHSIPFLFDPIIKIPLVIFEPGQTERRDIYSLTSSIDVLPTLLHYTGHEVPSDLPGQILPPFKGENTAGAQTVFGLAARETLSYSHITNATLMFRRGNMKVFRYSGYADLYNYQGRKDKLALMQIDSELYYEVFDLENDPEELDNLALNPTSEIQALVDEIEQFYRDNVEYPQTS